MIKPAKPLAVPVKTPFNPFYLVSCIGFKNNPAIPSVIPVIIDYAPYPKP